MKRRKVTKQVCGATVATRALGIASLLAWARPPWAVFLGTTGDHKTPGLSPPTFRSGQPMFPRQSSWQTPTASRKTLGCGIIQMTDASPPPWVWGSRRVSRLEVRKSMFGTWVYHSLGLLEQLTLIQSLVQIRGMISAPIRDALGERFTQWEGSWVCLRAIVWFPA